jgi:predicted Zn finger-like uncharacterized protein
MIIACPACATRYAVPDNAIGIEGRTVRCAKCRHSWFQDGPEITPPAPLDTATHCGDAARETAEPASHAAPTPHVYDDRDFAQAPSSFDHTPPFRPRRNPAKLWTILAVSFAVVTTGAMGAVAKFGLPDWIPLPQASNSQPALKLSFPSDRTERRPLANGNDFFNISGTITNIGQSRRSVPTCSSCCAIRANGRFIRSRPHLPSPCWLRGKA